MRRTSRLVLSAAGLTLTLLTAACADDPGPTLPSNLPTLPTAIPSGLPTALPTALPTREPSGQTVSAMGALIAPSDAAVGTSAGPSASCQQIVDPGWTVDDCGAAAHYAWVVERRGEVGSAGTGWQAYLAGYDQSRSAWVKILGYADPNGESVTSVTGRQAALSTAGDDVVFAFRNAGTGQILSYDIVGTGGDPTVLAHRELSHGEATLAGSSILDTEAEYPGGEPNCCPAYFQQSRVSWKPSLGIFVVSPTRRLSEPQRGDF